MRVMAGHMNNFGRIANCGAISAYNDPTSKPSSGKENLEKLADVYTCRQ